MADLIPFDDRDGYIWLNGKMLPWREAKVHTLCHAFHYGSGVFEGERSNEHGIIFKSREHSERLLRSAELIHMPVNITVDQLEDVKAELLAANKLTDAYIRILAFRGPEQMGIYPGERTAHVMAAAWEWGKYFSDGLTLATSRWRKADPRSVPVESKAAGNYLTNMIAKQEAMKAGFGDALMLHLEGHIAESTGSNIFFVNAKGELVTPIAQGRFLNGITRLTVIDIAKQLGIPVTERNITPDEIGNMKEVFVTGTAAKVSSVARIDKHEFGTNPGPVTKRLAAGYTDLFNSNNG